MMLAAVRDGARSICSGLTTPWLKLAWISGVRLGPAEAVIADPSQAGAYPKSLGGVEVLVDGAPVPLVSVRESSVVAMMPSALTGAVRIEIRYEGRLTNPVSVETATASPAIFTENEETGKGPAAARSSGGAISTESPSRIGGEVTIRVTGAGAVDAALEDGKLAADDASRPVLPVEVSVGGKPAELVSANVPSGQPAGIVEIKFRVPEGETGDLPLVVKVGDGVSQSEVTLAVASALQ